MPSRLIGSRLKVQLFHNRARAYAPGLLESVIGSLNLVAMSAAV